MGALGIGPGGQGYMQMMSAQALKDAPGKDEARGMLAGVLLAPVTQLMGTINEPAMRLLYALDAKKRKMEDEGGEAA